MNGIGLGIDLQAAIVGAIVGTLASVLIQVVVYEMRNRRSAKKFSYRIADLNRHIEASLKSLELDASSPSYFIVARLRFCKVPDGTPSFDEMEWLRGLSNWRKIVPLLTSIRNSDIFIEEVASRVDSMTTDQITEAISEAKINLVFLQKSIKGLGD